MRDMGRSRRGFAALVVALGAAAGAGLGPGGAHPTHAAETPLFRFVSMPDFTNNDIGDTRDRAGVGWDPGDPNSIDETWRRAIDVVLDQVEFDRPAFVLDAGDLVDGHWLGDPRRTGIFGPLMTRAQQAAAVRRAGALYYRTLISWFSVRNLRLYPAVGDHDIGDNNWPAGSSRLAAVPAHKAIWAAYFTKVGTAYRYPMRPAGTPAEGTAYAFQYDDTLVVTVDEFSYSRSGVRLTIDPGQLSWLDMTLASARARGVAHIIVQGHLPVLGPQPSVHSSNLYLAGGAGSAFWQLLQKYHVDLYLCGELHTVSFAGGSPVQVVHGSPLAYGSTNYLVGAVYPDRIELSIKSFSGRILSTTNLWQMGRSPVLPRVVLDRYPVISATDVVRPSPGP
jgi:3',5'-cyclic AMP phosphodiesterase CpdA